MKKTKLTRSLLAACSIVALSAVMYGCVHSGDGDDTTSTPPPVVEPTAYEAALAAIQAADTVAAAQEAYDGALADVSGTEAAKLKTALDSRVAALTPPEPEPTEYSVTLPAGHGLNPGMTMIPAGTTAMLASGTHITCEGDADCTLTIGIESVTGELSGSSTGGMVTVSTAATRLAAEHAANQKTLADARETLADLEAMDPGDVTANELAAAQLAVTEALKLPGNENAPENQPEPEPEPEPSVAVAVADFMYLNDENTPSAGTHEIAAGDTATNNGVIYACAEGGEDCTVTVAADGSATSTGGTVAASLSADAVLQVAQAKKAAKDAADAAALKARDQIIGKDRALEAAANLPASTAGGIVGEANIIITRGPSGPASVAPAGYSVAEDDPALPNGSWAGSHLTQAVAGVGTNHLFVYTDIEAPTRVQFYNWDGDTTTPRKYANGAMDALTQPANSSTPIPALSLTLGATGNFDATTADLTRFPAPQSPEEGSLASDPYPVTVDTDNDGAADAVSIPGNFDGAGGRYLCTPNTGTTCSVTVAPSGAYTSADTWTFVPELNSTAWQGDQEFMSFGWWLQEPTAATGTYTFRYYADGTAYQLASGNLAAGSATYNGRAAGQFVVQEIDDAGVTGGEAGMFTAAASLTARFSGTAAGGTLEGTISGFQSDNADVNVSGWSVALEQQTITGGTQANVTSAGAQNDPDNPAFDGATATMGDETAHGTWSSQFFGNATTTDAYPLGVGGVFQADNEAASIAGSFGARR